MKDKNDYTMKGRLTVKGVKQFRGMEGYGFNATLYMDNKKVCFVMDDANGGCFKYEVSDKAKFAAIEKYIKTLPQATFGDNGEHSVDVSMDILVDELVNQSIESKEITKMMKKTATALVVKTTTGYTFIDFKRPLNQVADLIKYVNQLKSKMKTGDIFLNKEFA